MLLWPYVTVLCLAKPRAAIALPRAEAEEASRRQLLLYDRNVTAM